MSIIFKLRATNNTVILLLTVLAWTDSVDKIFAFEISHTKHLGFSLSIYYYLSSGRIRWSTGWNALRKHYVVPILQKHCHPVLSIYDGKSREKFDAARNIDHVRRIMAPVFERALFVSAAACLSDQTKINFRSAACRCGPKPKETEMAAKLVREAMQVNWSSGASLLFFAV